MSFRVKFADRVRTSLRKLPSNWAELLAHRLREIADLAEIHPVSRPFQGPVALQTVVDGLQVHYEVDRDGRQVTVTDVHLDATGVDGDPGPARRF